MFSVFSFGLFNWCYSLRLNYAARLSPAVCLAASKGVSKSEKTQRTCDWKVESIRWVRSPSSEHWLPCRRRERSPLGRVAGAPHRSRSTRKRSPLLSLPLRAQASSPGVLNPPRLCALAGTSPCVRPHGTAGICMRLTGPGPGALSRSRVPPPRDPSSSGEGTPPRSPHSPSPSATRSPQLQLWGGSPDQPPAVSLPPAADAGDLLELCS